MSSNFHLTPAQLDELEKELEENPFNIKALSDLAQHYASQSDYTSASKQYEKIVRVNEENGKAWTALGHCYLLKGEYQKCFTAYQKAIYTMEDNRDPQLWYGVGLLYHKFESYEYAEPAYQNVLRIDPSFEQKHEVLYKLGLIYKKTGAFENAVMYLKNSIACENIPKVRKVDAMCHVGNCYEREGKIEEALEIYQQALEMDVDNFKTMEYLGWGYWNKKSYEEAIQFFTKAIDLAGENTAEVGDLFYLLGRTYLEMGKYTEGQSAFQKAIYKNPNAYLYWCSIGILYAKALQPQDAFECFVKASNISQETGDIWFNMAVLYEQCNQRQEACLAYQRSFTLDSSNPQATQRKAKLQRNEDLDQVPAFIHPAFELSEVPFSIKKNDKALKPMKSLPDINKLKKDSQIKKDVFDEESEGKLVESDSESSPYSPTVPEIKPKLSLPETRPAVLEPRRRTKVKTVQKDLQAVENVVSVPTATRAVGEMQNKTQLGFTSSNSEPQPAPPAEVPAPAPMQGLIFPTGLGIGQTVPQNPLTASVLNPLMTSQTNPNSPLLTGIPAMPPGMAQMFPMGVPNMAMLMNMMPNMMPASPTGSKTTQPQLNPFQMAMQNMMMTQMAGMMMNPMFGMMQMRMMGNKPQGVKKETEEELAETLTKMNGDEGSEENDELRKKRKGDKSKDLVVKKRKK